MTVSVALFKINTNVGAMTGSEAVIILQESHGKQAQVSFVTLSTISNCTVHVPSINPHSLAIIPLPLQMVRNEITKSSERIKKPCSPGRGFLLFSSTPRNETGDMPRENCLTVPVAL